LGVKLAKKHNGEIISADSRQVYRGLNIGSGKITKKEMMGIPHHLLDVANPKRKFSVAQFQKLALQKIQHIQQRGRIPFLVGGTGFYIQAIVDGIVLPEVKPNWKLRKKLQKKSADELFLMLKEMDPGRAKTIDAKNPHRLIRAIEIATAIKKPIKKLQTKNHFNTLQLGIKKSPEALKKLINKRLLKRVKGIIAEVKKLHQSGLSWKRLEELGLEYRYIAQYLQGKLTYPEMVNILQKEIERFSKRQMTWFKRYPEKNSSNSNGASKQIHWIKNQKEAEKLVKQFL
jgi:tRNA dimethylallyltransferase